MANERQVRAGETFEVTLDAQASAGFGWKASISSADQQKVRLLGDTWESARGAAVGAASRQHFRFQALSPGRAQIEFEYGRSWQPAAVKKRTLPVVVT